MRRVAIALVIGVTSTSCSWLFQDRLRPAKDGGFDGRSEPHCDDGNGLAILDLVIAGLATASLIGVLSEDGQDEYVGAAILNLAVHGASGLSGLAWAGECREAYATWKKSRSEYLTAQQREEYEEHKRDVARQKAAKLRRQAEAREMEEQPPAPRGFFCTSSPSDEDVGFCAREKADCESTRSALAAARNDMTACALVETAWCFDGGARCSPTDNTCSAQHMNAADVTGDCEELR